MMLAVSEEAKTILLTHLEEAEHLLLQAELELHAKEMMLELQELKIIGTLTAIATHLLGRPVRIIPDKRESIVILERRAKARKRR